MTTMHTPIRRRTVVRGLAGASALGALAPLASGVRAADYPAQSFSVVIPTGQGGGAERLARAFDTAWSQTLGQPFEYEFFPGAGGQVGYELFVKNR